MTRYFPTALEDLIRERYDVDPLSCLAIVVEWGAAVLAEQTTFTAAAQDWRTLNARRERLGVYTTIPTLGTELYERYFATVEA